MQASHSQPTIKLIVLYILNLPVLMAYTSHIEVVSCLDTKPGGYSMV